MKKKLLSMLLASTFIGSLSSVNAFAENSSDILIGDTNCNGQVEIADAVLIMQATANPDRYGINGTDENHITEQGKINADLDGDGLTVGDAYAILREFFELTEMPQIKIYQSLPAADAKYTEMRADEEVKIETEFDPVMSDWSGIGILLEFNSKNYPITLSTNEGHFTTWDKEAGSGPVENVGREYNIGCEGYIFWTPDDLNIGEDYVGEIIVAKDINGTMAELGKLVITMTESDTLSAVLKDNSDQR